MDSSASAMSKRGYAAIGLHRPKVAANVACALRAAGCYGASMVAASGLRYKSAPTDTQKAWRHMPLIQVNDLQNIIPFECVPVAVDLIADAEPLPVFVHPPRAFYIFGPEDGTLDESVLIWCERRVYIPTVFCMNLAATVNVVLYDRYAKMNTTAVQIK